MILLDVNNRDDFLEIIRIVGTGINCAICTYCRGAIITSFSWKHPTRLKKSTSDNYVHYSTVSREIKKFKNDPEYIVAKPYVKCRNPVLRLTKNDKIRKIVTIY